ncbi:MAG: hypothetical protein GX905_02580 [Bacteroidales bacterium]|nr:hypothetical protein [Bacteroidales bacterium]
MKLYLFNPEHDLALAHGLMRYLPPLVIRQFANDFSLLPFWYAEDNSKVLLFDEAQLAFLEKYNQFFNRSIQGVYPSQLKSMVDVDVMPWGWDYTLRDWLIENEIQEELLPDEEYIKRLTQLSHRSFSVQLLAELQLSPYFCGESYLFNSLEELSRFVEQQETAVLKEPLSGSGRGIMWCEKEFIPSLQTWAKRIIERQKGIVGEPGYKKIVDFAMEFYISSSGKCHFVSYSLFDTSAFGSYQGSYLLTDEKIEKRLSKYVPVAELNHLKKRSKHQLEYLVKNNYEGYLGVDMMICSFNNFPYHRIHPCVEVNFRMNMGIVASSIQKHFLSSQSQGKFETYFYRTDGEALAKHLEMEASYPVKMENNRVVRGYLPIVPITSTSRYRAWVIVE